MAKIIFLFLTTLFMLGINAESKERKLHSQSATSLQNFLNKHCVDCHDDDIQKGKIRLDDFSTLKNLARDEMLNKIEEQVYLEQMPPKKKKQPSSAERKKLFQAIKQEFESLGMSSKLSEKLKKPTYGNYVDHKKLFSGENKHLKGFTYDRNWLISEFIFNEKINKIIAYKPSVKINNKFHSILGLNDRNIALTNPFLLPKGTGVRYYANESLNGGHLLTMLSNARILGEYLTNEKFLKANFPPVYKLLEQQFADKQIVNKRKNFLKTHIGRVLQNIYQDKNQSYQAKFKPLTLNFVKYGPKDKKTALHWAGPSRNIKSMIFEKVRKYMQTAQSDDKIIESCEREWFQEGVPPVILRTWLVFMHNYIKDIKKEVSRKKAQEYTYKPLNTVEMKIIEQSIKKHRVKGDNYNQIITKCANSWEQEFAEARKRKGLPQKADITAMIHFLYKHILERVPDNQETEEYVTLTYTYIMELGRADAAKQLIETLFVKSEFSYRNELGFGPKDQFGRRKMSPRSLSYALAYAITDSSPDSALAMAAQTGKLNSKEDIAREVKRMLENRNQLYVIDERLGQGKGPNAFSNTYSYTPIRKLRFFREFFGYPNFLSIFKDEKRFGGVYDWAKLRLLDECDRLVDHIINKDQNVFEDLLTTENFYVYHSGDNTQMKQASDLAKRQYDYFKDMNWQTITDKDLKKHSSFLKKANFSDVNTRRFQAKMKDLSKRFSGGSKQPHPGNLRHPMVVKFFNIDLGNWNYPATQPAKVPNRMGILTHPAWLIAHAQNTETDPVVRGKFILEKLLAETVPDVPISVEAVVPEDHHKTLKQRLVTVTETKECWACHKKMNPLGYPFEIYDDFGRFRTKESIEHPENLIEKRPGIGGNPRMLNRGDPYFDYRNIYKTLPVDSKGFLKGTDDKNLDGDVKDAIDLIKRLAKSTRVRQSIIRHAFRYFLGRNEMLSDSKTLIDADLAYVKSGGSFDAVIVSLLTSDSFIYRKEVKE